LELSSPQCTGNPWHDPACPSKRLDASWILKAIEADLKKFCISDVTNACYCQRAATAISGDNCANRLGEFDLPGSLIYLAVGSN
jgi:hypothetical protein